MEDKYIEAMLKVATDNIRGFFDSLVKKGAEVKENWEIESGDAFIRYIEHSTKKFSYTRTLLNKEPIYFYDYFVEVDIEIGKKKISTNTIWNVINKNHFNIIVGSGGIGKTTVLKHLFLSTIKETYYIPIFVELRDLNNDEKGIVDYIYESLQTNGYKLGINSIDTILESNRIIFFFDAFDEIIDSKRKKIKKEISFLCNRYPDNYYIITSRELMKSNSFTDWSRFSCYKLCNLTKEQAVEVVEKIKYNEAIKKKFIEELKSNYYKEFKSFASNPLLLSIMLLTYDQFAKVPKKIHLFYEQAYQTLYSRHDANKEGFSRQLRTRLDIHDFLKLLSSFSVLSYIKKSRSFTEITLLKYIKNSLELEKFNIEPLEAQKDLVESLCILVRDGLEYIYTHRTFQEYFTAIYIDRLRDEEQKSIYDYILKKLSSSIREDNLLNMLFEINKERYENNLLLYTYEILCSKIYDEDKEKMYRNYVKLCVEEIGIYTKNSSASRYISLTIEGSKYVPFIEHVLSQYDHYVRKNWIKKEGEEWIEKNGVIYEEDGKEFSVWKLKNMSVKNEEDFFCNIRYNEFEFTMYIDKMKEIKCEYQNKIPISDIVNGLVLD